MNWIIIPKAVELFEAVLTETLTPMYELVIEEAWSQIVVILLLDLELRHDCEMSKGTNVYLYAHWTLDYAVNEFQESGWHIVEQR